MKQIGISEESRFGGRKGVVTHCLKWSLPSSIWLEVLRHDEALKGEQKWRRARGKRLGSGQSEVLIS